MNIEFIIVIYDYFRTLKRRDIINQVFIPFLVVIILMVCSELISDDIDIYSAIQSIIPIIGVLLGCTLAAMAILINGGPKKEELQAIKIDSIINKKQMSLYDKMITDYSYLLTVETICCVLFTVLCPFKFQTNIFTNLANSLFMGVLSSVMIATLKLVSDLYFVMTKK